MAKQPPATIALDRDEYHAQYVGRLADGRQFFITFPFDTQTGRGSSSCTYSTARALVEARIEARGQRGGAGRPPS